MACLVKCYYDHKLTEEQRENLSAIDNNINLPPELRIIQVPMRQLATKRWTEKLLFFELEKIYDRFGLWIDKEIKPTAGLEKENIDKFLPPRTGDHIRTPDKES